MSILGIWRSLVVLFLFCFFGGGALFINFIIFPAVSIFVRKEKQKKFYCTIIHKTWNFFSKLMEKTGIIKIEIETPEKFEELKKHKKKGDIIVANHPSFIDIVLLIGVMPDTVCIAKKEIKKNIFMGNIVKSLYLINDENNEKMLKDSIDIINSGFNIIIFPTGTRTLEGEKLKLHKGASMMALHTGADILPVYINCDYKFLAKKQNICDAGEKTITYKITANEKIKTEEFSKSNGDLTEIQLRNRINQAIKEKIANTRN